MAAFDFPSNPSNGDTYTANGVTFVYDSSNGAWKKNPASLTKGDKGEPSTDKGNKGDKGDKGETIKGEKGTAGADNSTKGQKGEPGADNSTKGNKGDKGDKGDKGIKGDDNSTKGQKGEPGTGGSVSINNDANDRVITAGGGGTLNAETYLTWDGATLLTDHTSGKVELIPSNGCIEITRTAGGAFIDFKNSKTEDFDVRIQQEGTSDKLIVYNYAQTGGDLEVTGNIINKAVPKAFVNFHGGTNTNGNCTMRDAYGVSSVSDNGTGNYTVYWSSNFPNVNYTVTVSHSQTPNNGSTHGILYTNGFAVNYVNVINFADNSGVNLVDKDVVCVVARTTHT